MNFPSLPAATWFESSGHLSTCETVFSDTDMVAALQPELVRRVSLSSRARLTFLAYHSTALTVPCRPSAAPRFMCTSALDVTLCDRAFA